MGGLGFRVQGLGEQHSFRGHIKGIIYMIYMWALNSD